MAEVKTVGIRDLKNKLSAYLREVRAGVRLLVSDRDTVVAELHEPYLDGPPSVSCSPPLTDWVRSGMVRLPTCERRNLLPSPVHKPDGLSLELLDEDRG
jgi:hypothetical protein